MVFVRMLPLLGAITFFAGNALACTCGEANISDEFNSPEVVVFRGTVLSSNVSSQCLAKMKAQPEAERAPEAAIVDHGASCSVSNTLEILEYLKGRLTDTLVVQTQPLFMGIGSCARSLPPGSTFTIVASYDGVNEITVDQCNTVFSEQDIPSRGHRCEVPAMFVGYLRDRQPRRQNFELPEKAPSAARDVGVAFRTV
ncbi:MAG: hypothetical protein AB7E79_10400 [Rhodospirillaceae bacterium]